MVAHIQESIPKDTFEKLAVDIDQFSFDYDTYGYRDAVDDREQAVRDIMDNMAAGHIGYLKEWLQDIATDSDDMGQAFADQAKGLLSRMQYLMPHEFNATLESGTEQDFLRFYVAECMEFPVLGEYHKDLTFEQALEAYERIPAERMHGIKGIGIQLHHNGEVEESDILSGTRVEREWIDMLPNLKDHPLIQKALSDVETYISKKEEKEAKKQEASQEHAKEKDPVKKQRRRGQEL